MSYSGFISYSGFTAEHNPWEQDYATILEVIFILCFIFMFYLYLSLYSESTLFAITKEKQQDFSKLYESLEKSPKEVQEMLKKAGITPKGAYQLFTVDNPEEFFEKYVVKGNSIHITSPMKVKEDYNVNGGKYENKAYQIDFGNG